MTEPTDIIVSPGRVESRSEPAVRWKTSPLDDEALVRAVRTLAEHPALDGLIRSGRSLQNDRRKAGLQEDHWMAECACGERQPCRHAQSLLFRFRKEAERTPALWWIAAGADPEAVDEAIRSDRAKLVRGGSEPNRYGTAPGEDGWERRAELRVMSGDAGGIVSGILEEAENPLFWNRELPFAEWVRPLLEAVRQAELREEKET